MPARAPLRSPLGSGLSSPFALVAGGPSFSLNFTTQAYSGAYVFTRASSATYFDVTGTRQTATTNTLRIDYDRSTHVCKGALIEEQRTNFLLNSGAPVTQTTASLGTGTYTLWLEGSGTATSSAGSATATGLGAASSGTPNVFTVTVAGTITVTVAGGPTLFQLENGAFATSYIPTTGATATRAVDDLRVTTITPWSNTLASSFAADFDTASFANSPIVVNDIATASQFLYLSTSGNGRTYNGTTVLATVNTATVNTLTKIGVAFNASGRTLCLNGGATVTDAVVQSFFTTGIRLGDYRTAGQSINGHIQRLRYWPRVLSAAELKAATT